MPEEIHHHQTQQHHASRKIAKCETNRTTQTEFVPQLHQEDLNRMHTRVLSTHNPEKDRHSVVFHHKEGCFRPELRQNFIATQLHRQNQFIYAPEKRKTDKIDLKQDGLSFPRYSVPDLCRTGRMINLFEITRTYTDASVQNAAEAVYSKCALDVSSHGVQTYSGRQKNIGINTQLVARANFSDMVDQGRISDAYEADILRRSEASSQDKQIESVRVFQPKLFYNLGYNLRVIERMICQNNLDGILTDFHCWNDPADELREQGSLYPLWRFKRPEAQQTRVPVSSICWSKQYTDLFYVGYGEVSYKPKSNVGAISVYSLKCPLHPEWLVVTSSGVMSVDVDPQHAFKICAGLFDGSVHVYVLTTRENDGIDPNSFDNQRNFYKTSDYLNTGAPSEWRVTPPTYTFKSRNVPVLTRPHVGPCWSVQWADKGESEVPEIFSLGSDGRLICWSIQKNSLNPREITQLRMNAPFPMSSTAEEEAPSASGWNALINQSLHDFTTGSETIDESGYCIAFQKKPHIFLCDHKEYGEFTMDEPYEKIAIGTGSGAIVVYTMLNSDQIYYRWPRAHQLPVQQVCWNPIVPNVLLSCSFDWTVKFWTARIPNPVLILELFVPVSDVCWAPYSSTTLALTTRTGLVQVFDLCWSKTQPLATYNIVRGRTHVAGTKVTFNRKLPLLLVGDEWGDVISLKLSPNLRQRRVPGNAQYKRQWRRKHSVTEESTLIFSEEREKLRRTLCIDSLQ